MQIRLNIDNKLIEVASGLTGINDKTVLVRMGLDALIERGNKERLARLGNKQKD